MREKIFITGATGCIGHYILDRFIHKEDVELHLLLRGPERIRFDVLSYPNIKIHIGKMEKAQWPHYLQNFYTDGCDWSNL